MKQAVRKGHQSLRYSTALLLLLGGYTCYGVAKESPYRRRFVDTRPDELVDGFLTTQEIFDTDEARLAEIVGDSFVKDTLALKERIGLGKPEFHEPHWGHTTGLLRGTLHIDSLHNLPLPFRVGLYSEEKSFPVICRVNYASDADLKLKFNRLALKIHYDSAVPNVYSETGESNEIDLLLGEGDSAENGSGRSFFFRDAREAALASTLKRPSLQSIKTLSNWRNFGILGSFLWRLNNFMAPLRKTSSLTSGWAGKPYFSAGPYALGKAITKFSLRPRQSHPIPPVDLESDPTIPHKDAFDRWLEAGQDATFDLMLQLATPESIPEPGPKDPPKSVMASEYCDLVWDEKQSPFFKVGTLVLEADAELNQRYDWSPYLFQAWNTLPEMRPLGQLFRIRRHVHLEHTKARLERIYDTDVETVLREFTKS